MSKLLYPFQPKANWHNFITTKGFIIEYNLRTPNHQSILSYQLRIQLIKKVLMMLRIII
jgi:hypothetical protein